MPGMGKVRGVKEKWKGGGTGGGEEGGSGRACYLFGCVCHQDGTGCGMSGESVERRERV